jgi:hypothetical protein
MTLKAEANQQLGNWKEAEGFLRDTLNQKPYLIEARILWLRQLCNDRNTKEAHDFGIATEEWIDNTLTTANFFQIKDTNIDSMISGMTLRISPLHRTDNRYQMEGGFLKM